MLRFTREFHGTTQLVFNAHLSDRDYCLECLCLDMVAEGQLFLELI
jgi:hypothetical protein